MRPPGHTEEAMAGRIVVGVDGSERADAAVNWAVAEARLRGSSLEVVHAWTLPHVGDAPGFRVLDLVAYAEKAAGELLDRAVAHAVGQDPDVNVTGTTEQGPAGKVLVDAAEGADMLVVGSRGRGGFAGLLLGSVSQACVHHAPCPVVVIPSQA